MDSDRLVTQYETMNPVLYSTRLVMTPFVADDVDIAIANFTDPKVRKYTGGPMPESDIRAGMDDWTKRGGNGCLGVWCIKDKANGEKLGTGALLPIPIDEKVTDWSLVVPGQMPDGDIEIGYFLKRSAWGKGFATEACQRLLKMAFEDSPLDEVVATFDPNNAASRGVLEKSGFVDRGPAKSYGEIGPNFRITRDEWSRLQQPA